MGEFSLLLNFEREAKLFHALRTEQIKVATARVFLRSLFLVASDHNSLSEDKILNALRFAINVCAVDGPNLGTAEMHWSHEVDDWEISFTGLSREIEFRVAHSAETQMYECIWEQDPGLAGGGGHIFMDLRDAQLSPANSVDVGNFLTDLEFLNTNQDATALHRQPIWSNFPEHIDLEVSSLLNYFNSAPKKWAFWHQWYQGYLSGDPVDAAIEYSVSRIPEAIWDEGVEAVAHEIEQIRTRWQVETALVDLKNSMRTRVTERHGIGGNNPPESIEDERLSGAITLIWEATEDLSTALEEERPAREWIEAILAKFKSGLAGFLKWCAGKGDLAVDTLIKWGIPATGAGYAAKYPEKIEALIKAIEDWLPYLH